MAVDGTVPHYQIVLTREQGLDKMEIKVEVTPELFSDKIGALETLRGRLGQSVFNITGIHAKVTLVEPRSIPRSEGKAKRVLDQRKM